MVVLKIYDAFPEKLDGSQNLWGIWWSGFKKTILFKDVQRTKKA